MMSTTKCPTIDFLCHLCQLRKKQPSLEFLRKSDRKIFRKFCCDFCEEGFQRKYFLLHHMIASHENNVKDCRKCDLRSYSYLNLQRK